MRYPISIKITALALLLLVACSQSKWSKADQDNWLKTCHETFVNNTVSEEDKAQLEDLCDCMLKLTSRKYTVEEAKNLTEEQERKLLNDCNYAY